MNTLARKIRLSGICLVTAAAIALPCAGQAGSFGSVVKSAAPSAVVKKAARTAGKGVTSVQDAVGDIADKLDEVYSRIEDNRPLLNVLNNGQMVQQLTDVVEFLNESQEEFQQFAESGVYVLREDVKELAYTVTDISDMLNLDSNLSEQLQKSAELVDRMPAVFLFALAKSGIDRQLQDFVTMMRQLGDDLLLIAALPPETAVFLYPEQHMDSLCPLVNDPSVRTRLAVLKALVNYNLFTINTVSGLLPEDLTVNVTVVGGGGATFAKFPLQYIFKAITAVLELIQVRLESYESIAGSMCSG